MWRILFLIVCAASIKNVISIQCVDPSNNSVEWYAAYKLPVIKGTGDKRIKRGTALAYITSEDLTEFKLEPSSVEKEDSMISLTLAPLYSKDENIWHILYNDEPVTGHKTSSKGHTKGVVVGNSEGGIWLVHSVPKFPPLPVDGYSYPGTGMDYGQSFLCISFNLTDMNKIGIQLQYNEPKIYSSLMLGYIESKLPEVYKAANNTINNSLPGYSILELAAANGTIFRSFAKNKFFGKDLYKDLLAPNIEASWTAVETWPKEPERLSSNCSGKYWVYNMVELKLPYINPTVYINSTHDHSKVAVSTNYWVCIGDINRAVPQMKRGGGTVCLQNEKLSKFYMETLFAHEECKN